MGNCQNLYTWADNTFYEWVDTSYTEFGECYNTALYQVWKDDCYIYTVTSSGLDIFDVNSTNKVAYINNSYGFTTIWGNIDTIYLGTTSNGIKYLEKSTISGGDLEINLQDYDFYYNSSSNEIRYLHGYNHTLAVVTDSSIDVLYNNEQGFKSTVSGTNFTKCFLTSKNELYYVIHDNSFDVLCKINSIFCDWVNPSSFYRAGESFLPEDVKINDIFITENTSSTGEDNTIFVATTSGVFIVDEQTNKYNIYYTEGAY